jgi:RNA polymerase sigma factor (sigma-70 family)
MNIERLLENSTWVQSLAASLVSDPHEADDLVQDTWVAALRRPPRQRGSHRSWLRRVLRNFAYISFRSRSRRLERERLVASPEAISSPQEAIETAELARRLVEKVLELDEPSRMVVILRYFDGLTGPEIATRLGIQPGAVRMRLKRALDQLRRALGDDSGACEAWRGLLLVPLVAAHGPAAEPALHRAASGSGLTPAAGLRSLVTRAALVITCLGAGCLIGSRLAEPSPRREASAASTTVRCPAEVRIAELETRLEQTQKELGDVAAWRHDIEARLRSTQEAVAQLSSRLAALEDLIADPA